MLQPGERITHMNQVAVQHCDTQGHMNTRFIEGFFDDATGMAFGLLGADPQTLARQNIGWADRKHSFEFLHEILAPDLILVLSRPLRVGRTSITFTHRMVHAIRNTDLASSEIVTVCFDLEVRTSRPLPDALAREAERWRLEGESTSR